MASAKRVSAALVAPGRLAVPWSRVSPVASGGACVLPLETPEMPARPGPGCPRSTGAASGAVSGDAVESAQWWLVPGAVGAPEAHRGIFI